MSAVHSSKPGAAHHGGLAKPKLSRREQAVLCSQRSCGKGGRASAGGECTAHEAWCDGDSYNATLDPARVELAQQALPGLVDHHDCEKIKGDGLMAR